MCLSHFHYAMSDRWKRNLWPVHHQFKRSKENPILGLSLLWAWVKEPLCFLELLAWHWLKSPLLCNTLDDIKCRYIVTTQSPPPQPAFVHLLAEKWRCTQMALSLSSWDSALAGFGLNILNGVYNVKEMRTEMSVRLEWVRACCSVKGARCAEVLI